ncbi:sigma-54-dependent Fis family transcriptional regulator [Methylobacterium nodulans]|uniref:GAF modulated sigma54 specific transcriptional regulator, Fis family n=1 Tax=Methylobacterium nodulans (strain LMG 21967 / CNCM I-2342 / ORS 2060) TaxID=460265 RepID=B8IPK1_METNO|nr:sigma-54-dependent Fis family transcriptional regulator [Methylobacterium nodulans]ACL62293.1 GAF modulated sigma54 specific transcriptional regulator, Fis family [Methylobacterium nodulans ORS 2060]
MESRVATPRTLLAARQRVFAQGGVDGVPDPILRSWQRCAALGLDFGARPRVEPLTERELREAWERNDALRRRCRPEIEALHADAQATDSLVILTDANGLVLDTIGSTAFAGRAAQVALRPGVPWSEAVTGTNAIGTALIERRPVEVHGPEHYFEPHRILSCAAMPILGMRGETLGALDLSGPAAVHHMHALGLIRLAVDAIEHRQFEAPAPDRATLRLHYDPALLGTPREGVLVFAENRLVGANRAALALLGLDWDALDRTVFEALFPDQRAPAPGPLSLRDGAGRALRGHFQAEPARPQPRRKAAPAASAEHPVFDPGTEHLLARAVRLLDAGIPIVVEGETGTGKEVFSRSVHARSARAQAPFVAVNCAALPESLIEAELFGYEPGAFTGAARHGAKGLLRQADGGLLFLDEIGDMPLSLQSRLLRVLQEREVQPVGGGRPVPVDFTLICATHRDLGQLVEEGRFRADLYYRIAPYRVALPPLRARSDRLALVRTLWDRLGGGLHRIALAPACAAALAEAEWPGNFRQLVGTLRALLALADPGDVVGLDALPETLRRPMPIMAAPPEAAAQSRATVPPAGDRLDSIAREAMRAALDAAGGNVSEAARRLGISRSTLYRRCLSERG